MTDGTEITFAQASKRKHKSLLAEYELPIDHLDYKYIRGCECVKELERIVKVLRSGQEGTFPDLQRVAEDRLRTLSPHNRLLRTEEPALNKNCLDRNEWEEIEACMKNWRDAVSERDRRLNKSKDDDDPATTLPCVRQPFSTNQPSAIVDSKPKPKKKVSDYALWDKYDVDTELLKLDLEVERQNGKRKTPTNDTEKYRLELVAKEAQKLSEAEKEILAEQEILRGNEFYQAGNYVEAKKYYTASLAICSTAKAYNNRASCHLKQRNYSSALEDADSTLKLEPDNVKALFRKSVALKNEDKFQEALENMNAALRLDPDNLEAQKIVKQLMNNVQNNVKNKKCDEVNITNVQNSEILFEKNEWGLPKIVCCCRGIFECNAKHDLAASTSSSPLQHRAVDNKTASVRIIELPDEYEAPKIQTSSKLEIVEIETTAHEPIEDYCIPKKCNVVDKRSLKAGLGQGATNVL